MCGLMLPLFPLYLWKSSGHHIHHSPLDGAHHHIHATHPKSMSQATWSSSMKSHIYLSCSWIWNRWYSPQKEWLFLYHLIQFLPAELIKHVTATLEASWILQAGAESAFSSGWCLSVSVAAARADHFEKISDNKLNKIDKNMKIKRRIE